MRIASGERRRHRDRKEGQLRQGKALQTTRQGDKLLLELKDHVHALAARPGDVKNALEEMQHYIGKLMK